LAISISGRIFSASLPVRRADHARQTQRAFELGGGGGNIHQRQRGKSGKAARMFDADRGQAVVDHAAQRDRHLKRLRLDPAHRAGDRQCAGGDALPVHAGEMVFHIIESLGQRLFAHA
jgi:hypothetical protein